jgi:hypothetical protein
MVDNVMGTQRLCIVRLPNVVNLVYHKSVQDTNLLAMNMEAETGIHSISVVYAK